MNTTMNKAPEREEIEALLPWHAAGTLSRRDAARVERALANDNELARRYELVREELGETIVLNESLGAPSARAMKTLFAKIDAEPVRTPKRRRSISCAWLSEFIASFRRARWPMPAGAAAFAHRAAGRSADRVRGAGRGETQLASANRSTADCHRRATC